MYKHTTTCIPKLCLKAYKYIYDKMLHSHEWLCTLQATLKYCVHHTTRSETVTWHLIPPLISILMTFLKAGWPDLTIQHYGKLWWAHAHTLHGRKHRDGFAYEEVWASLSPFLCWSQLVTDTWQRDRTEAGQKQKEKEWERENEQ